MGLNQLLIKEDLNETAAPSAPDFLADPSGRKGVIGPLQDDMMVRMNRTLLPLRAFEGLRGRGFSAELLPAGRLEGFLLVVPWTSIRSLPDTTSKPDD